MKNSKSKKTGGISKLSILSFVVSLILCSSIIFPTITNKVNIEKVQMEQLVLEKGIRINEVVSRLLYKTEALAMLAIQDDGNIVNFEKAASSIANDPAILNVLMAPDGIVTYVYSPEESSYSLLGFDFFSGDDGNLEAAMAVDGAKLVMAGPFVGAQGVMILAGRLPVFLDSPEEGKVFWGLVSVTLRFPQALDDAELIAFENQGFAYELWRINPDTDEKQIIAQSLKYSKPNAVYIEKSVLVLNADWYLRVSPVRVWYDYIENITLIISGIFVCLLVFFIVQNNHKLNQVKKELEVMAISDPLTGIFNRRHFMETANINIENARRYGKKCYIVIFDMDEFKSINDTYGHIIGDHVLIEVSTRIKKSIRPYDLFARYGGEEFIVFIFDANDDIAIKMVERLRLCLCDEAFEFNDMKISLSASFGIANIDNYDIKRAIKHADAALYKAKNEGRNKAVVYEKST